MHLIPSESTTVKSGQLLEETHYLSPAVRGLNGSGRGRKHPTPFEALRQRFRAKGAGERFVKKGERKQIEIAIEM